MASGRSLVRRPGRSDRFEFSPHIIISVYSLHGKRMGWFQKGMKYSTSHPMARWRRNSRTGVPRVDGIWHGTFDTRTSSVRLDSPAQKIMCACVWQGTNYKLVASAAPAVSMDIWQISRRIRYSCTPYQAYFSVGTRKYLGTKCCSSLLFLFFTPLASCLLFLTFFLISLW